MNGLTYKSYKAINDTTSGILEASSARIECKLGEILHERGINQTDLSILTGIRYSSINDLLHNRRHSINKNHLLAIMLTLKLTSIEDMYEVVFDDEAEKERLQDERIDADALGLLPEQRKIIDEHKKD